MYAKEVKPKIKSGCCAIKALASYCGCNVKEEAPVMNEPVAPPPAPIKMCNNKYLTKKPTTRTEYTMKPTTKVIKKWTTKPVQRFRTQMVTKTRSVNKTGYKQVPKTRMVKRTKMVTQTRMENRQRWVKESAPARSSCGASNPCAPQKEEFTHKIETYQVPVQTQAPLVVEEEE